LINPKAALKKSLTQLAEFSFYLLAGDAHNIVMSDIGDSA